MGDIVPNSLPDGYIDVKDIGRQTFLFNGDYYSPDGTVEIGTPNIGAVRYRVATFLSGPSGRKRGTKLYFSEGISVEPVEGVPLTLFGPFPYKCSLSEFDSGNRYTPPVLSSQPRLFE